MPRKPKTPPPVITPLVTPSPASTDWVPLWNLNADPQLPPVVNGQWIKGVGGLPVWSAILPADVGLPKITSQAIASGPPSSPADGDIWIATAVDAAGTVWQFRYNAGSASAYKWEFIGGSPATVAVVTDEPVTTFGATVDVATVGPQFTIPRNGDYDVYVNATFNGNAGTLDMAQLNSDTTVVASAALQAAAGYNTASSWIFVAGAVATKLFKLRYYVSAGPCSVSSRTIKVFPKRIS